MKKDDLLTVRDLKDKLKDLDDDAIVTSVGYDFQGGGMLQGIYKQDFKSTPITKQVLTDLAIDDDDLLGTQYITLG